MHPRRNGGLKNNIAEHHLQPNHRSRILDLDSDECVIYNTDYYQTLTIESSGWFPNLGQTPLN